MTGNNPAEVHREQGHRIFGAIDFERKLDGLFVPGFPQLLDQPLGGMVG
jgi:hypothetical protein